MAGVVERLRGIVARAFHNDIDAARVIGSKICQIIDWKRVSERTNRRMTGYEASPLPCTATHRSSLVLCSLSWEVLYILLPAMVGTRCKLLSLLSASYSGGDLPSTDEDYIATK
jgi:hypothetical protein